jgi:hypothetical protein
MNGVEMLMVYDSPPCKGGVAAPLRKNREATEAAQTGWSRRHDFSKRIPKYGL